MHHVSLATLLLSCALALPVQARQMQTDDLDISNLEFPVAETSLAAAPKGMKLVGSFKPSFYWIALEEKDGEKRDQTLLDEKGDPLLSVSASFLKALKMEGTGRLLDGRLLNFKTRVTLADGTKEIRYRWCDKEAPFGFGYEDLPLVPFKSLAVDPTVIPIGSKVYIPAARGAILPDGTKHDGYFTALDIGDAIQEKRIDVFTSFGDQSRVFGRVGMEHMKAVEVYLVH